MDVDTSIKIQNISKKYILGSESPSGENFREMLTGLVMQPWKRLKRLQWKDEEQETFWALKDITFDVKQGEVLGIIGRNGAGKSTLLKILSRITTPTTGEINYRGRVASLLEVGTGFHPELTGRENIYLNGAILGMGRAETSRKLDQIAEFAGVEKFLETPVKRYSSGMYVRLAFSVAAHIDPDILIVDEVLAVGDQKFQDRCINTMRDVANTGRTVIFVSHNMSTIQKLCQRGIVLANGKVQYDGEIEQAISTYLETSAFDSGRLSKNSFKGPLSKNIVINSLGVNGNSIQQRIVIRPDQKITIELEGQSDKDVKNFSFSVGIFSNGVRIMSIIDTETDVVLTRGKFISVMVIPEKTLRPGVYTLGVGGEQHGHHEWLWASDVGNIEVLQRWQPDYEERRYGIINTSSVGSRVQTG